MKTNILNLVAITSVVAFNVGTTMPALADTLTTVTTTTTEAPVESYHYRRVIAPVTLKPYEKLMTIKRSSVIKNTACHTTCTKSHHAVLIDPSCAPCSIRATTRALSPVAQRPKQLLARLKSQCM